MLPQEINLDADFDSQLHSLSQEATQSIEERDAAARRSEEEKEQEITRRVEERMARVTTSAMPQMLRPLVLGLEAVTRAAGENTSVLQKLDRTNDASATAQAELPALLESLQTFVEQKNGLNQRMFDALLARN